MGYSRKRKNKQGVRGGGGGGVKTYFFENLSGIFRFFYFTPGSSRQNKSSPLETPHNYATSFGKLSSETKTSRNSILFFP